MHKYIGNGMCSVLVDKSTDIIISNLLIIATIQHSETSDSIVPILPKHAEQWTAEGTVMVIKQSQISVWTSMTCRE
jgi:hypothetical protein